MKHIKIAGATLLETMLVLAISAMVIVLSLRYYQQSNNANSVNQILQALQAISAATDSVSSNPGGSGGLGSAAATSISGIVGANGLKTPFGNITLTSTATAVTISIPSVPAAVCSAVKARGTGTNAPKFSTAATCASTAAMSVVYTP